VRQARAQVARAQAATAAPRVLWAGLDESQKAFSSRVARECTKHRGVVLAVVPCGHTAPTPARPVYLPAKHFRLLHPTRKARYRVPKGGRGSAKSWSIARALILTALEQTERVLCAREFQKSIAESSHKLLSDQIDSMGLRPWFDVKNQSITCHNNSEFIFEGLHANLNKIRSLEGVTICWVEEAAKVTTASWEVLIPTIRTTDSELWINFNPEDEHDPTYDMFVTNTPPDAFVEHFTYQDNPFFPTEMEAHRQYLLRVDPDAHAHVYGGECRKQSEAQVFRGKYVVESFEPGASWDGPYHGSDFGFANDPTTLLRCWIHERTLFIEHEAYRLGCDTDKTPDLYDHVPGAREHIIRADSARPETISYLQRHGYPCVAGVEKWPNSVEEGVKYLRSFERIVVHPRCEHTAQEMRLYSYKVDRLTGDVLPDLVDKHNHTIDALRYALQPLIRLSNGGFGILQYVLDRSAALEKQEEEKRDSVYSTPGVQIAPLSSTGWGKP